MSGVAEWVTVGAEVAEFDYDSVALTTIERLTATQIVLANGNRYRKDRLRRSTGQSAWSKSVDLLPADDPKVVRQLQRQRIRNGAYRIDGLARDLAGKPDDLAPLHELAGVVQRLLGQVAE